MKNWIEIFRAGTHVDSAGNEHTYTEKDLDAIIAGYNPKEHEAPAVIGHPKHNAPAYGWVEGLKRNGKVLLAKFRQVVPEFAELIEKGMYKKRSISLYPDLRLRHVGFLGAMPPAVKGLGDIEFAEGEEIVFEFSDIWKINSIGRAFQRIRDWLIAKDGIETADSVIPQYTIDELKREETPEIKGYSEEEEKEMDEKLKKENEQLKSEVTSFSEKNKVLETENAALKQQIAEKEIAEKRNGYKSFCENLIKEGRMKPADLEANVELLMTLDGPAREFAEGDKKVSMTPAELFKNRLAAMPKVIEFGEFATKDKSSVAGLDDEGLKIAATVNK